MSKSHYIFYCLLSAIIFEANGQIFGTRMTSQISTFYPTTLSQPQDGQLRALCFGADSGCCPSCKVLVFDKFLSLIDSVRILKGFRPDNNEPIKINNRLFWAAIYNDTLQSNKPSVFSILELDTFYNHVKTHDFATFAGNTTTLGMAKINNTYYAAYWLRDLNKTIVYKLNDLFVKTDSLIYNVLFNDIKAFGSHLLVSFPVDSHAGCANTNINLPSRMKVIVYDTLFNQISCTIFDSLGIFQPGNVSNLVSIFNYPQFTAKVLPISSYKYLAMGSQKVSYSFSAPMDPYVVYNIFLDKSHNKLTYNVIGNTNKNTCYFDYSNYSAIKDKEIVTVGVVGYDFQSGGMQQQQKTKIFVSKTDTNGNKIWFKEFGNDMFYRTNSIVYTLDGGCLISGTRFDSARMGSNSWESFLLKLDSDGNYNAVGFSADEISNTPNLVTVFPNPACDELRFKVSFPGSITIELYNSLGQVVLKKENYSPLLGLDINFLAEDIYFYKVILGNHWYTGKISICR